jgi:lipopolysaccharide transport system permease protein
MIVGIINESAYIFPTYRPYILQSDRSLLVYLFCSWFRWLIIFGHHVLAAVAVLTYLGQFRPVAIVLTLVMLPVFAFAFGWMSVVIAIVGARFRDIPPMVANVMQVAFFVTPIMFMPDMVKDLAVYLELNPFTQLIALIREPMLGRLPSAFTFGYSAVFGTIGWILAAQLYRRARPRVAYWL